MPSHCIRIASISLALCLASSCSQNDRSSSEQDVHEAPNVEPSAAPSVAWRYSYDFQLPDDSIAAVQETHASKCEALGLSRCRITGLRYSVSNDNAVSAQLEVKLTPEIARQFGKQAAGDVRKAGGRLSNTEFTGEDTQPLLSGATNSQRGIQARIDDIQRQLAGKALKDNERAQLQSQLEELRSQLESNRAAIVETQAKLAATPMTFNYHGRGGISGFAGRSPIMDAARSFVASLVTMISFVLQLLALLLPWTLLLWLAYLFARSKAGRAVGRFIARGPSPEGEKS
jgi:hypothetical protein